MEILRKLKIKTLSNAVYQLQVAHDIKILQLKEEIFQVSQVPIANQRLVYMGRLLNDNELLSQHLKEDDQTILMMANTNQQASQPAQNQQQQFTNQNTSNQQNPRNFFQMGNTFQIPSQNLSQNITQIINDFIGPQNQNQQPQSTQNQTQNQQTPQQQPNINQMGSTTQQQYTLNLPHQHIQELGFLCNSLMGEQTSFPGPIMPQMQLPRTGINLLGGYLYQYQFAIQRTLPFMQRTAQLMQRESLIDNPQSRLQVQQMANQIGKFFYLGKMFEIITKMTLSVAQIYQDLIIGPQPQQGQVRMTMPNLLQQYQGVINNTYIQSSPFLDISQNQQPYQNQQNTQSQQQNQQQQAQDNQINIQIQDPNHDNDDQQEIQVQMDIQLTDLNQYNSPQLQQAGMAIIGFAFKLEVENDQNMGSNQISQMIGDIVGRMSSNLGQDIQVQVQDISNLIQNNQVNQQQNTQGSQNPVQNMISNLLGAFQGASNQQPYQQQQNTQQQGQPVPQQNPQPVNFLTITIGDLIQQNYQDSLDESDLIFLQIFGCIKLTEMMQMNSSGNTQALNSYKSNFKEGIQKLKQKYNNDEEKLIQEITKNIIPNFYKKSDLIPEFYEGIEPESICHDIIEKNVREIMKLIQEENYNENFHKILIENIKQMMGEVPYELSQALPNGIDDYKVVFAVSYKSIIDRLTIPQQLQETIGGFLQIQVWNKVYDCYLQVEKDRYDAEQLQLEQQRHQQEQFNSNQQMEEEVNSQEFKDCQDEENPMEDAVIQQFQLRNEIIEACEKDNEIMLKYSTLQVSERYKQGDPMKE